MLRLIMGVLLLSPSISCLALSHEADDEDERRAEVLRKLQDPANVWPMFQKYLAEGEYSKAHELLSKDTKTRLQYPAFFIVFASYEAPRRLVAKTEVHKVDPAGRILLCSPEFGVSREVRLVKFMGKIWTLELTPDDIDYFRGRPMEWYRHQVKSADGWHFAYPPDWTYAPLRRH